MTARVPRSISAAKLAAAEKVARPTSRYSFPRLFTCFEPKRSTSGPYVVLSPPPLRRTSTITRRVSAERASRRILRSTAGAGPDDGVVADVHGPSSGKGSRPQRLRAVREIQRPSGARQHRRVVPVQRIGELSRVLRAWHRRQRDVRALPAATLERELGRSRRVDDPEAVEHLRRERVVRSHAARVRRVVVRHQRVDQLEAHARPGPRRSRRAGHPRAPRRPRPRRRRRRRTDTGESDTDAAAARCAGSPGKRPVCPLRGPSERDDPKDADEELVPRDARRAPGQRLHLGLEPLLEMLRKGAG